MTWLIFVSEPTEFICTNTTVIEQVNNLPPGVLPPKSDFKTLGFDLKAIKPMRKGVVRIALANNCTTGENAQFCDTIFKSRDQSEYTSLLRQLKRDSRDKNLSKTVFRHCNYNRT